MNNRNNFGILLISGAVALCAIFIAIFTTQNQPEDKSSQETTVITTDEGGVSRTSAAGDQDEDRLPNWKEALLGTDPDKSDSDGDGTNDGDEVAAGSDPLVFGTEPKTQKKYTAPTALSPTDALGRELFATYLGLKENGQLNSTSINASIDEVVARYVKETDIPTYALTDIVIGTDESTTAHTNYRKRVDAALSNADNVKEYELKTVYSLLETSDLEYAKVLINDAAIYQAIVEELLAIPTPASKATTHIDLVNALSAAAYAVRALGDGHNDPYELLVAVNLFVESEKTLNDVYLAFNTLTPPLTP